jgi:seryl-tRNA synthetase
MEGKKPIRKKTTIQKFKEKIVDLEDKIVDLEDEREDMAFQKDTYEKDNAKLRTELNQKSKENDKKIISLIEKLVTMAKKCKKYHAKEVANSELAELRVKYSKLIEQNQTLTKGQLISEVTFHGFPYSKTPTNCFTKFLPQTLKWVKLKRGKNT